MSWSAKRKLVQRVTQVLNYFVKVFHYNVFQSLNSQLAVAQLIFSFNGFLLVFNWNTTNQPPVQ